MEQIQIPDTLRQINELAVSIGRAKQSALTGFIHASYHGQPVEERDSIPVYENFLFALALLRTRTSESVLEAKALLEKLLHFQAREGAKLRGNFPIYLHEYPACKDRYVGVNLLPVIYWILKGFHHVIGAELRQKLEGAVKDLLIEALGMLKEHEPPLHISIKVASSACALGKWLQQSVFEEQGKELLANLQTVLKDGDECLYAPSLVADMAVSLQMTYISLKNSPWSALWDILNETWHRKTCCYVGPAMHEFQSGHEPQATLYDLYMGSLAGGTFSARALKPQLFQLQGALIHHCDDALSVLNYPLIRSGSIRGQAWQMVHEEDRGLSVVQQAGPFNMATGRGFHPLRMVWGDAKRVHTFACQGGNASAIDFTVQPGHISLFFTLQAPIQFEDREKARDVIFFIDEHEGVGFKTNGHPSNTFQLSDKVSLEGKQAAFSLNFSLVQGSDASYFGHFMRGNRASQINLKGDNRFKAFDWQLFLRAIKRESCKLKVDIGW